MGRFLSLISLLACGCSSVPFVSEVNGHKILEHPYTQCPEGESPACATQYAWQIFYKEPNQRKHELDHVNGLVHTKWVWDGKEFCADVLIPGDTEYSAMETICGYDD